MLNKKALAGTPSTPPVFVEDVFSTYLYTGNSSTQTITNGIDLAGKGGMVWTKSRSQDPHSLQDTTRGITKWVASYLSNAEFTSSDITNVTSSGFSLGYIYGNANINNITYASWTFRKQAKFFDVVTYTGNGANRTIAHNLGSVPGSIIVKRINDTGSWQVYHRSLANTEYLVLDSTAAKATGTDRWNSTTPTSTVFSLGTNADVNASGGTYVAYIFAHDAGGFGTAGTDNVITCGTYTETSGTVSVDLGYEPQWLLVKPTSTTGSWYLVDNMRGFSQTADAVLFPNLSSAESAYTPYWKPTATGFTVDTLFGSGTSFIYIAIRRGPMKTPTSGTSVFAPVLSTVSTGTQRTIGFPADATFSKTTVNGAAGWGVEDRLRGYARTNNTGQSPALVFNTGGAEDSSNLPVVMQVFNTTYLEAGSNDGNAAVIQSFGRAPGFFDIVCYTGTGANRTVAHNLGVVPELMIVKCRSTSRSWDSYAAPLGNTKYLAINLTAAEQTSSLRWNDTSPTSSVFSLGTSTTVNASGDTYVAYLFASVAGVSKVGSYTGNGTSVTVTTGFQPRYILVKRTDSTGNWIQGDSARGLVAGDDPALFLNTTAAETTGQDWVDVSGTGFTVNETALNANVSTATYIFLAIA